MLWPARQKDIPPRQTLPGIIGNLFGVMDVGRLLTKFMMALVVGLAFMQFPTSLLAGPAAVSAVSPSGTVNTSTPTYVWSAESLASKYRLVVINAKKVTLVDQWYTKEESNCSSGSGSCSITPGTSLAAGDHTWYAIANSGVAKALSPKSFSVVPVSMSTGSPSGQLSTAPSSFNWGAVSGSTFYLLTVTKSGGTPVTKWVSASGAECSSGSGTCRTSLSMTFTNGTYSWTVNPYNGTLKTVSTSASFTLTLSTTNALIVSPTGAVSTNTPTYIWNAESGASSYLLKVTNNSGLVLHSAELTPTAVNCAGGTGTCSSTPSVTLPAGTVHWSITALPSKNSGQATITVPTPTLGTPSPIAPKGTVANLTPGFSWSAVQGASQYRLRVTDSSATQVIDQTYSAATAGCSSGSTCSVSPGTTLATGSASWTIMALDSGSGAESAVSTRQTFTVTQPSTNPGTPTPVSPSGAVTTLSPTFTWNATTDANAYILRVTDASAATMTRIITATVAGCPSSSGTCSTTFPNPFTAGAGSWTVQGYHSDNNLVGTASSSLSFTLSAPSTASTLLVSPIGTLTTNTPTYVWNAEAGATGYLLKVTTNSGLVLHYANLTPTAAGCAAGTGTCSITPATTLPAGIIKWSVAVVPSKTTGEATINIPTPSLSTPSPIAPKGTVASLTPSFSWSAVQGASHYRLRVTDASNSMVIDQTYTIAATSCSSGSGTCSISPGTTLAGGSGYWTIMALHTTNNTQSAESSRLNFTLTQAPTTPGTPTLIAPSGAVTTLSPTFSWNAASNANGYIVKVTDASANTFTRTLSATQGGCQTTGTTCATTFPNPFVAGAGSWTVQAYNSDSNLTGTVSDPLSFTLSVAVPTTIMVSPAGNTYDRSPTLTWNAIADATQYLVKIVNTQTIPQTFLNQIYTTTQAGCASGTGQCSVTPSIELTPGTYIWSVGTMPVKRVYEQTFTVLKGEISLSASTIAENTTTPVKIGTLSFSDSEATPVYSVSGGTDQLSFEIKNSNELWVKSGVSLNHESKASLGVQVTAGGSTQPFTIQVTDVNEAPTDLTLSASSVDENRSTTTNLAIATLTGVDPDKTQPFSSHTFSIVGGTDQAKFAINGQTLELVAGTALDYESMTPPSFQVQIKVTDGGSLTFTKDVTIAVNNLNEAPTSVLLSAASVNENIDTAAPATIATMAAIDPDSGDTFTFSVTGGTHKDLFTVNGSNLQLKAGTALNYEAMNPASLNLEITATDSGNLSLAKSFTLTVNDINEAPTNITVSPGIIYSNVDTTVAMSAGTLTVTDPDANNTHTCTVSGGTDQTSFQVSGTQLQLKAGSVLNISTKPTYSVEVTCTDAGNLSLAKTLTVTLQAIDRSITIAQTSIDENTSTASDISLGTLTAVGNNTFAIAGGTDQASFTLVGSQLYLKAGTTLDYETKSSFSVLISNSDALGGYSATVTLSVNDLNEAPTNISLSNNVLPFIARPTNAAVGTLSTTDQDGNESFTYTLPDTLNGRFAILGDQLLVVETDTPVHGIFDLTVRVSDKGNLTFDKSFSITVVGFSVESIPENPGVATMLASARTTYANIYNNLARAQAGTQIIVSEEEFENMVLGKVAQQLTDQGTFTQTISDVVNKFDIQITANLITVTIKVALVDVLYSRISSTTRSIAQSVLDALAPYASGYTLGIRMRIKPVVSGLNVSLDTSTSYVDFVDESDYVPTVSMSMSTLISTYNSMVNALASNDLLAFFLGGGAHPPAHFLNESFGSAQLADAVDQSNQTLNLDAGASRASSTLADRTRGSLLIPLTQRVDYYFPGLVASVTLQENTVTLTRSSLDLASAF
ncbi:MAG: cadherin domain-containing protein [Magnetococcales bacterium]|nr:cadherin domain-containing protein [Magnetococcales bacterium]